MPIIAYQGTDQQAFLGDLHLTLAEGQRDVLDEAFKRANDVLKAGTEAETERLAKEIADATGCTERTALGVLKCVTFLAMGPAFSGESVPEVSEMVSAISQLAPVEKGGLKPDEESRLQALLERLVGEAKTIKRAFLTGRVIRGVLPMFQDLQATLELRSTRPPLRPEPDDLSSPLTLVPIASIQLVLDSGDPQAICFQAREEDLAELQRKIEKLQKELKALKDRVQVTP